MGTDEPTPATLPYAEPPTQPGFAAASYAILVAALGYFVDIFDLVLFGVVRTESLTDIGIPTDQLLAKGLLLLNIQAAGMLFGGFFWGVIADRYGRRSVLFGSILMYSVATLANAWADSLMSYAVYRAIAGVGLAGELGAGITLVVELMGRKNRGYGPMIIANVGLFGAITAALLGNNFSWRTAYIVGGALGFALLALRMGSRESDLFLQHQARARAGGDRIRNLFALGRVWRYIALVLVGIPAWYVTGQLATQAPELSKAIGLDVPAKASNAILFDYVGLILGNFAAGVLSEKTRSRILTLKVFLGITVVGVILYFTCASYSLTAFYAVIVFLGFGTGYWALAITSAAESFGTNLRGMIAVSVPNMIRGALIPMNLLLAYFSGYFELYTAGIIVGAIVLTLAFVSLLGIQETFDRELDYVER